MFIGPNVVLPLHFLKSHPNDVPDSQQNIMSNRILIEYLPLCKVLYFFVPIVLLHIPVPYALPEEIRTYLVMLVACWPVCLAGTVYMAQKTQGIDSPGGSVTSHSFM